MLSKNNKRFIVEGIKPLKDDIKLQYKLTQACKSALIMLQKHDGCSRCNIQLYEVVDQLQEAIALSDAD